MNNYQVGDLIRLSASFVNNLAAAADPTTVSCLVKQRHVVGASTTTYTYAGGTITKDSTGNYHVDVTPTDEGYWDYRWVGTGIVQAAVEGAFFVPDSWFF